jgi:hypothetical protein
VCLLMEGPGRWLVSLVNRQIVKSTAIADWQQKADSWSAQGVAGDVVVSVWEKRVLQVTCRDFRNTSVIVIGWKPKARAVYFNLCFASIVCLDRTVEFEMLSSRFISMQLNTLPINLQRATAVDMIRALEHLKFLTSE